MQFPQFTRDYILALTRKSDVYQYNLWSSPPQREIRIRAAASTLNSPAFTLGMLKVTEFRGKQMFMPQTYEDKLYIRHLSYRIRTSYRVHAPNRDNIVEQVGHLLKCDTQLQILRTDIRRFFQSIPFQELIDSLQLEGHLRSPEIRALRTIFDQMMTVGQSGLPWGLSLSSPLAEVFMRTFDQACRRISGVIYYQRFVDDIIIFAALPVMEVEEALRIALHRTHPNLRLNSGKTFQISEIKYPPSSPSSFHYLGYYFERIPAGKDISFKVSLSTQKLLRIKKRVSRSAAIFQRNLNWRELRDRVKLLTGNVFVEKSEHPESIKAGIFYSHRALTEVSQLALLDTHLRAELVRLRSLMSRIGRHDLQSQIKTLFKFSFAVGFEKRTTHNFSAHYMEHLYRAWAYVR